MPFQLFTKEISIATYNVENLFDTHHDEGKNDWEYTPIGTHGKKKNCQKIKNAYFRKRCLNTDWNVEILEKKMAALKSSLLHGPYGLPDILILNEVENTNVFKKFNKILGYDSFFITDSPDARGIDNVVALKSSIGLKVHKTEEISIPGIATRNILKIKMSYGKKELLIYAHHWPSQFSPSRSRILAAKTFARDLKKELMLNSSISVISLGDFNVLKKETPNALKLIVEQELNLVGLHEFSSSSSQGSYFYKRTKRWSHFDRIYISKNLIGNNSLNYVKDSFKIGKHKRNSEPYLLKRKRKANVIEIPERFNFKKGTYRGASDHYPVFMKLQMTSADNISSIKDTSEEKGAHRHFPETIFTKIMTFLLKPSSIISNQFTQSNLQDYFDLFQYSLNMDQNELQYKENE